MPTIERVGPNFVFSLFRYLTTQTYTVGVTTGKLTEHFSGLKIRAGYPDDLLALATPVLALVGPLDARQDRLFYGGQIRQDEMPFVVYGFVLGQGSDAANRVYRDRLFNDLYQLLSGHADDTGFTLYDHQTETAIGVVELEGVRGRLLPVNAPDLEADRFKFLVEGRAHLS